MTKRLNVIVLVYINDTICYNFKTKYKKFYERMTLMDFSFEFIKDIDLLTSDNIDEINSLLKQLNPSSRTVNFKDIGEVIKSCFILIVKDMKNHEKIIGLSCLAPMTTFISYSARIEDVVIDEGYRGKKFGKKMMEMLIEKAREEGIQSIGLTSHPSRIAANALYKSLGFVQYETNVYSYSLDTVKV